MTDEDFQKWMSNIRVQIATEEWNIRDDKSRCAQTKDIQD